jgi:hypothetical protein
MICFVIAAWYFQFVRMALKNLLTTQKLYNNFINTMQVMNILCRKITKKMIKSQLSVSPVQYSQSSKKQVGD